MKRNTLHSIMAFFFVFLATPCCSVKTAGESEIKHSLTANSEKVSPAQQQTFEMAEDPVSLPIRISFTGAYLKAFLVASEAFHADENIPPGKKRLEYYTIECREDKNFYYILFLAQRLAHEKELDGGESKLGKDVMFVIKQKDFQLVKRSFFE